MFYERGESRKNFSHAGGKEYFFDRQLRSTRQRVNPAPGRSSPAPQPAQSHRPADILLSLKLSLSHLVCQPVFYLRLKAHALRLRLSLVIRGGITLQQRRADS